MERIFKILFWLIALSRSRQTKSVSTKLSQVAISATTNLVHHSKRQSDNTEKPAYNSLVALNLISGQRSSVNCRFTRLLAR